MAFFRKAIQIVEFFSFVNEMGLLLPFCFTLLEDVFIFDSLYALVHYFFLNSFLLFPQVYFPQKRLRRQDLSVFNVIVLIFDGNVAVV